MSAPPPYPRISYLLPSDSSRRDDITLAGPALAEWLDRPVVVEEKLDGANVSVWLDDGGIHVASRGGAGSSDRGGQLGRLRAWVARRAADLVPALDNGRVLYGEWMWRRHTVRYDRLPDWFVLLDVRESSGRFWDVDQRNTLAHDHALVTPPELFRGVLGSVAALDRLMGTSQFSSEPAEGLVVVRGATKVKVVRPGFQRFTDAEWGLGADNALAAASV